MAEAMPAIEWNACDQTDNQVAVSSRPETDDRHSKRDLREINSTLTLPQSRARDMAALISEVNNMNWFQRFMDSKVPNNSRSFWRRFSFTVSDLDVLKEEIAKHEEFYKEMEEAFLKVRNCDEDAEEVIEELFESLLQLYSDGKLQADDDDSKKLCRLHQEFVAERDKLENSIRRADGVNTRRQLKKTRESLNRAVEKIDEVTTKMERTRDENKNLLARVETLVTMNEQLMSQQQDIRAERQRDQTSLRILEDRFEQVLTMNEKLVEDKKKEREKNDLMMTLLENLLQKPQNGEE